MADCGICRLIAQIKDGSSGDLIAELRCSYLILGDAQYYRGYSLMLAKHHATELHLLPAEQSRGLLDELVRVGNALYDALRPHKLNYECLGNLEPHLHWHLFPRSASDPLRFGPIWIRPESERKVILEESDRRSLIDIIQREVLRQIPAAKLARQ